MQRFIILHTNDIHGRVEGLACIATVVKQIRTDNPDVPVFYFDAGDIEENSTRLSNLTKGLAMHKLLTISGCDAVAVGNGGIMRYGYQMLPEYAKVAHYPLLLANVYTEDGKLLPGVQPATLFHLGSLRLGVIGVTSDMMGFYNDFSLQTPPVLPIIKEHASQLRQEGANVVALLSHLGLDVDREIAVELQQDVSLIIGAHTHNLLPDGEWVGRVLIAQAGEYANYLGRLDLALDEDTEQLVVEHVSILPVTETIQPASSVLEEVNIIETEIASFLAEVVGELAETFDYASDRECGAVNLMADMLRERMNADVGIVTAGAAFTGPLPAGPLQRATLWDVCSGPGNPGVVAMTGPQLVDVIQRGLDSEFAKECPRPLRGQPRGLMHVSGASITDKQLFIGDKPVESERIYKVAGSDWELDSFGGYTNSSWNLKPTYDFPVILREALEVYLKVHRPTHVEIGRIDNLQL